MKSLIYIWLIAIIIDNVLPWALTRFYPHYSHKEKAFAE